ncbi:histidine phosphatase family protein [Methyloprofundus sp.]|uniref:histidine phosphatase family protein n=1 Tax=Methyloprofundus sp. TaxID=2020875 RepID=UPI003D0F9C3D
MARVIAALIRHGDYQQLSDTPSAHQPFALNAKGLTQGTELAAILNSFCNAQQCQIQPMIATSKLLRAWQTAQQLLIDLNQPRMQIQQYADLAERCVGSVANLTVAQIRELIKLDPRLDDLPSDWKSDSHYCLPFQGAESLLDAGQRVAKLLTAEIQILQQQSSSDQLKIFVGHGAAFRHAAYHLGIIDYEQIALLSMFHCQPVYIECLQDGSWQHIGGAWKIRSEHSQYTD